MGDDNRYKKLLGSHIGFLERSAQLYDSGYEDEALRLAASMRVIFHDTDKSISLLTHLQLKGTPMLSSARGLGNWWDYLAQILDPMGSRPISMKPMLGEMFVQVSMVDWWDGETIFIHEGTKYTRQKIIRSVANKDGGVHVDADLEDYYEVLCAGEYAIGIEGVDLMRDGRPPFPQGVTIYPDNAHVALIRQFVHETPVRLRL